MCWLATTLTLDLRDTGKTGPDGLTFKVFTYKAGTGWRVSVFAMAVLALCFAVPFIGVSRLAYLHSVKRNF